MQQSLDVNGVTIREFVLSSNVVFAVAWEGPIRPDMTALLGSYFPNYVNVAQSHARGTGPMVEGDDSFAVESTGRLGRFSGMAYLPREIPQACAQAICNRTGQRDTRAQPTNTDHENIEQNLRALSRSSVLRLAACGGGNASNSDIGWKATPDWIIPPNGPDGPAARVTGGPIRSQSASIARWATSTRCTPRSRCARRASAKGPA